MKRKRDPEIIPVTNPLHGQFDTVVDAVLGTASGAKNSLVKNKAAVETWAIPLQDIYGNKDVRLDASHYDRQTAAALQDLANCKCPLKPLSELATVNLPGQFVRIWAKDKAHGVLYVNATDLMSLTGIGALNGNARYLSKQTETDIEELIIHEGWLLMTCSGTIGRVFYVPKRMDGWIATHDLIRIIPKEGIPVGFIHAYLSSPVAQKQIIGHTHGGQIDHVTHHQIGSILVPLIPKNKMLPIHERTMEALKLREQAIATLTGIADDVQQLIEHDR